MDADKKDEGVSPENPPMSQQDSGASQQTPPSYPGQPIPPSDQGQQPHQQQPYQQPVYQQQPSQGQQSYAQQAYQQQPYQAQGQQQGQQPYQAQGQQQGQQPYQAQGQQQGQQSYQAQGQQQPYSQQPNQQYYQQPYQQPYYYQQPYQAPLAKDHVAAGLLGIFLGALGIHKFYLGYNTPGFIMLAVSIIGGLVTCSVATWVVWLIGVIEGIIYLTKSQSEFEMIYAANKREWF